MGLPRLSRSFHQYVDESWCHLLDDKLGGITIGVKGKGPLVRLEIYFSGEPWRSSSRCRSGRQVELRLQRPCNPCAVPECGAEGFNTGRPCGIGIVDLGVQTGL